jgi:hypothetical protein
MFNKYVKLKVPLIAVFSVPILDQMQEEKSASSDLSND